MTVTSFSHSFAFRTSGINYPQLRKKSPGLADIAQLSPAISLVEGELHFKASALAQRFSRVSVREDQMMVRTYTRDWREISQAASQEQDSEKLLQLVHELNQILECEEKSRVETRKNF